LTEAHTTTAIVSVVFVILAAVDRLALGRSSVRHHLIAPFVVLPLRLLPDVPLCVWVVDAWLRMTRLGFITTVSFPSNAILFPALIISHGTLLFALLCQAIALRLSPTLQAHLGWPNDVFRLAVFASAATVLLGYTCIVIFHLM
jgi:hypothetical protein